MGEGDELNVENARGGRRALQFAAGVNVLLAIGLFAGGFLAHSSGLLANALDNASDVGVYLLTLFAMARGVAWKTRAATLSGAMLLVLAVLVLVEVARRALTGVDPLGPAMMIAAVLAAFGNLLTLRILHRDRKKDVNLRAAWKYSTNDFLANGGVLLAGLLVFLTKTPWPDLVIGLAIALYAAKSGIDIVRDARATRKEAAAAG